MKIQLILILIASATLFSLGCERDDDVTANNDPVPALASISGAVVHHARLIPNAMVYIKRGAIEFPGTDTNLYDMKQRADSNAHFKFTELRQGPYYLYGIGYDLALRDSVFGGLPVTLVSNEEDKDIDVPVTE